MAGRSSHRTLACLVGIIQLGLPASAFAGPPFLTDDPEPTETGHWEIYGPLIEGEGHGPDFEAATGVEINFGAAPNLQLTVALPINYSREASSARWGAGDIELGAKYRIYHSEKAGISIALFPGMTLPTGSNGMGSSRLTALLPVWLQKDAGGWSVFGGGGYAINPGTGNRDYWTGGVALTRQVNDKLLLGLEADRQGADAIGGRAATSLGFGAIYQLDAPFRILASGGPTLSDGGGKAAYHLFAALGVDF